MYVNKQKNTKAISVHTVVFVWRRRKHNTKFRVAKIVATIFYIYILQRKQLSIFPLSQRREARTVPGAAGATPSRGY
jgi:glycopeptide antibiotics resistance protein